MLPKGRHAFNNINPICSSMFAIKSATVDKVTLLSAIKILLIINFIFIGSPTATHALIEAGYNSEVDPWENDKK